MTLTIAPASPVAAPTEDETFTLTGLSWEQYVAIGDALGDQPTLRTLFLDGSLTFLSPSFIHEWSEHALDAILLAICVGCEIEMEVLGSTTLRKGTEVSGIEGDEVYYLRENVALSSGPRPIDLNVDPPPDLAIEVENSNQAVKAMSIYARLGVSEVWRHDVRKQTLTFWSLQSDGTYQSEPRSLGFPFLTPADVLAQVELAKTIGSRTRWFAQLTAWVRAEIRPRLN